MQILDFFFGLLANISLWKSNAKVIKNLKKILSIYYFDIIGRWWETTSSN